MIKHIKTTVYWVLTLRSYLLLPPLLPPSTGVPKCSGWVNGSWSRVSLSAKCLPLFKHNEVRLKVVMSPSSNTKKNELEYY
jgi:hypothetical protein